MTIPARNTAFQMLLASLVMALGATVGHAQTTTTTGGTTTGSGGSSGGIGAGAGIGTGGTGGAGAGNTGTGFAPSTASAPIDSIAGSANTPASGNLISPTATNPLFSYFANPYSEGLGSGQFTGRSRSTGLSGGGFGQPSMAAVTSTRVGGGTTGGLGTGGLGTGLGGAGLNTQSQQGVGFTTIGMSKAPPYVTSLSEDFERPKFVPSRLQQELTAVLNRSSMLPDRNNIGVTVVDNSLVVLRGVVTSGRQRRLAESLIRLTPGVRDVQNDIQVLPK